MKRLYLIALALATPVAVLAQTTVFSDNFSSDLTDPSSSYLNGQNGVTMSWANGTGITLAATVNGKSGDLIGGFNAVTLANTGDYISFIVNFNSPNIANGVGSSIAGNLLMALDYSGGTSPTSGGTTESVSSSASGGATAGYLGYLGQIAFNSSPKTSTRFSAKVGPTSSANHNNLSYYSNVTPSQALLSFSGTANTSLVNSHNYTLTYTETVYSGGATPELETTATIYDNTTASTVETFSLYNTANGLVGGTLVTPTTEFDVFDIGLYTGGYTSGYTLNLSSVSVLTDVAVPEPASMALVCGGIGLFALVRRFRR